MRTSIGIFDSGLGGLTVLKELRKRLKGAHFFYFGDTARTPYGAKSEKTIIRYSLENSHFLLEKGVDLIVVACNTASSLALSTLKACLPVPVIGVIEPTCDKLLQKDDSSPVGVIGTRATIGSQAYQKHLLKKLPADAITAQACPLFVPLIEEDFSNEEVIRLVVREYLAPFREKKIKRLILGCTHYPLLQEYIAAELGKEVSLINPADAVADAVESLVKHTSSPTDELIHLYVSDDPERFATVGKRFFGNNLPCVEKAIPSEHEL